MQTTVSAIPDLAKAEATADIFLLAYRSLPLEAQRIVSNRIRLNEFWENKELSELARLQQVSPLENIDDLDTDFWPADDSIEEMLETIRSWRDAGVTSEPALEQA